jgi:flavin reductase (DIM6/NTAB) family NADH-FMN oxidoreductase RutF
MSAALLPLFSKLTHGVYVVGVAAGGRANAFAAAWLMQASFDPPMLALSVNPAHSSYALLKAGGGFTVNVLARGQEPLARHFGQPASADKLAAGGWRPSACGAPLLDEALAWFECEWAGECPAGDHALVLGRVVAGQLIDAAAEPLNYRAVSGADRSAELLPERLAP